MDTLFWSKLKELCAENGTTPTSVCKAIGLSTGSPPMWKRGTIPNPSAREKIAAYFGVDPSIFVGAEQKESQPTGFDGLTDDERKLLIAFRSISEDRKPVYLQIVLQGGEQNP